MRLLVCGGREFSDEAAAFRAMDAAHRKRPISCVIEGDARGADRLAKRWAKVRGVPVATYPANWDRDGKKRAGPIRNQRMLDEGRPDGVLALPGGVGTADMVRRARAAGLPVWQPYGL